MEEWLGLGRPTIRRAAPWLAATALLGGLFLGGQWIAWKQLVAQRVFFASNPSSHFFYLITGTPGLHLIIGVWGWQVRCLRSSFCAVSSAPGGGGLYRVVLAGHGRVLDFLVRHAGLLPIKRGWLASTQMDASRRAADSLHMWTQIVGKTRLALRPLQAHWSNVPLYVSARGLNTSAMPYG